MTRTHNAGLVFLLLLSSPAFGQYKAEEFEAGLLQARYGAMLVYNGQRNSFTLKFVFKSVEPTDKPNFVRLDSSLMQSTIVPFQKELDFGSLDEETQKSLLKGWKKYEKDWAEDQLKIKINEKEEFLKINGKVFLYWSYDMPKSDDPGAVAKQVDLVTICFDHILILNGPIEKGKLENDLRSKFMSIAKTLEINPGKILDIKKLYYELKE